MFFLFFFLLFRSSSSLKISHLTALLQFKDPRSDKTPHFTISAEGDCFNWTSLNPNIVRVIPNYQTEKCSTSAEVQVVATGPTRRTTSILAESSSGSTLKCDVFVDSVKKISILTTTRSIYLESSLETLSLLATDSENNAFTSLEGTDIKWKIDKEHIRTISTEEAKLFLPEVMPNKSASLIIKGAKIGETYAEATLNNELHAHVDLVVVKSLLFLPSPIIKTLPYHHIPFKLCSARGNKLNQDFNLNGSPIGVRVDQNGTSRVEFDSSYCVSNIQLPSNSYSLSTSNTKSLTVDQYAYATTHEVGESTITATDATIKDNIASTLVYVMYPKFYEQPEQYIALHDDPVFNPILKDENGRPLDIFEPIEWRIEGTWDTVGTKFIKLYYHDYNITAVVHVCPPLYMDPPEAVLPVHHEGFKVRPIGGSGFYEFSIETKNVLSYSNTNYQITTFREGRTKIRVYDLKIKKYFSHSDILVSKVARVDIDIERRELNEDYFKPKCSVYAIENRTFSVDVKSITNSTNHDVVSPQMRTKNPGFAEIYCEAVSERKRSPKILVSTASDMHAKVDGRGSPESLIPLIVSGGVLQWKDSRPPKVEVSCLGARVINFHDQTFSIDREYNGFCTATMQNAKTSLNPVPLKVTTEFWLNVSNVDRFDLYVTDKKAAADNRCNVPPQKLPYSLVMNDTIYSHVRSYRVVAGHSHKLFAYPRDANNNIIRYYSAVPFDLHTSLGEVLEPSRTPGRLGEAIFYYTPSASVDITITSPKIEPSVTSLFEIKQLVIPASKTVYFKPRNSYTYPIEEGSGTFATFTPNVGISTGSIQVFPKRPETINISVSDVCTDQSAQTFVFNAVSVNKLVIEAPPVVFVNTEFNARVKAYDSQMSLIPNELLPDAEIFIRPNPERQVLIDTWRMKAGEVGTINLQAVAENGKTANTTVQVIDNILIEPQYIELLPGDRETVIVVNGPTDIEFEPNDGFIAEVEKTANRRKFEVVGLSPGNITIYARIRHHEQMHEAKAFPIHVRVLRPISLLIDPSTKSPIQYGYIGLRLSVLTDGGYRIPRKAKWNWSKTPSNYKYSQYNDSYAFINLTTNDPLREIIVAVDAYSLRTEYITSVEPKLVMTTPQIVSLPPHCTFQIGIENYGDSTLIQSVIFESENESVASCENGLIRSFAFENDTTIRVILGHQRLDVTVRVTKPVFLHLHQVSSYYIHLMLLDPFGLEYSSVNGVKFSLTGPERLLTDETDHRGFIRVQYPTGDLIGVDASASNSEFALRTSASISVRQRISPDNVVLMKGASIDFMCTALTPYWSSSDSSVLRVSQTGQARGIRAGSSRLSCGPNINTIVNVVEMVGISLANQPNDEFQIYPRYSSLASPRDSSKNLAFKEPDDLKYACQFEHTSCASALYKHNESGHFCVLVRVEKKNIDPSKLTFEKDKYVKCPPKSKLYAFASSESTGLQLSTEALVSYYGKVNFNIPNDYKVTMDELHRIREVPVGVHFEDIDVKSPDNIDVEWLPNDAGIRIRALKDFKTQGIIVLQHRESGEKVEILVTMETSDVGEKSLFHKREFKISKEVYIILAILGMFAIIFLIIMTLIPD